LFVREGEYVFKLDMSESTARFTFVAACGLATFAAAASIMLGLRESVGPAAIFLALAVVGCVVTMASYNQYTQLRNTRWRLELKRTEEEMTQVLNHARMGLIIEHATGPLRAETAGEDAQTGSPEDIPVAKP
jgi:hypothetical protein